jgi:hypothetical protein
MEAKGPGGLWRHAFWDAWLSISSLTSRRARAA